MATTRAPRNATKQQAATKPAKKATGRKAPAKKTTEPAPAKKTTTRKTAAQAAGNTTTKATTSAARAKTTQARAKADDTAKAPAKAPAKSTTRAAVRTEATQAAAKKTTAWPEFITHKMIHAHYQARLHGLPTRNIRDWRELTDGTAALHFPSGARLDHTPQDDAPFHANTPCPGGNIHRQPVRTPADLADAEKTAKDCTEHTGAAAPANIAITRVAPTPKPAKNTDAPEPQAREISGRHTIPAWSQQIPVAEERVAKAAASAADTQSMSLGEIADGITRRVADTKPLSAQDIAAITNPETAKEHPQP